MNARPSRIIAIIPNNPNHRIPVHAMATVMFFLVPGEFILLPKAAQSYVWTIETDKNRGVHLLKPSLSWAACSFAQARDRQESCRLLKKLQVGFPGPFFHLDQNSEQPKKMMWSKAVPDGLKPQECVRRSGWEYLPIPYREELQNGNGCYSQKPRSSLHWARWVEGVCTVTRHSRAANHAPPTNNHQKRLKLVYT